MALAYYPIFGFQTPIEEADLIILPVPWEGSISFRAGTANAPEEILRISNQIDHFIPGIDNVESYKISAFLPPSEIIERNLKISQLKHEGALKSVRNINVVITEVQHWLREFTTEWLKQGKIIAYLGGDHSITPAFIHALSNFYNSFSILHIDAHADLRSSYDGLEFSHASAMYHCLQSESVDMLTQVGIRDISPEEAKYIRGNTRIQAYHSFDIHSRLYSGETWTRICEDIISSLSDNVYVSFDIDALSPENAPFTGTPVPGGLTYMQAIYLLRKVGESRRIIGFDLVEVGYNPVNNIDCIIAAHLLYHLSCITIYSQQKDTTVNMYNKFLD